MSDTTPDPTSEDPAKLLTEWINADTWNKSEAILKANAERLLSDEALTGAVSKTSQREEVDRAELRERAQHIRDPHRVATADRPGERLGHHQRPHAYMLSYSRSAR